MLSVLMNRGGTLFSNPFDAVRREFDRSLGFMPPANGNQENGHSSGMSLWEDQQHVYLELDVPGMRIEDLNVTLEKGQLWIRGERRLADRKEQKHLYDDRTYGKFQRIITLQDAVDPQAIEARLNNGVLHITLTKRPEYQPFRIEVKEGHGNQARITSN